MRTVWPRPLTNLQVGALCLLALTVHTLPLVLADYAYAEDIWRAQLAERQMEQIASWGGQGRILVDAFYTLLSFGMGTPSLFPLPLLIALPVTAWAMQAWVRHSFSVPDVTAVLVVLALWFQPLFLQNLSYQFEGPVMGLAIAACLFAVSLQPVRWRGFLLGMLLVAVALSIYQVLVNVFVGLCAIEVVRQVLAGSSLSRVWRTMLGRVGQLAGGCALHLLTAHQLIRMPEREVLLKVDSHWPGEMLHRLQLTADKVSLLLTPGSAVVLIGLAVLALLGLGLGMYQVARCDEPLADRLAKLALLLLAIVGTVLLVPGMALIFESFNDTARMFMGLGPMLMLLCLLAYHLLERRDRRLGWLLVLPLMFMLSFSYAYGRVLVAQKELDRAVASSIAQAITQQPELRKLRAIHMLGGWNGGYWLPAAEGTFEVMPALRYVLNVRYLVLPEMMPRVGLTNFGPGELTREQVLEKSPVALAEGTLFTIHRVGDEGYVLIKASPAGEDAF